jgi:hypothetical protein
MGFADVTLGEIGRQIADVKHDLRGLRAEVVRRDVYDSHRSSIIENLNRVNAEVSQLETRINTQEESRNAMRRAIALAGIGAIMSLIVNLVVNLPK